MSCHKCIGPSPTLTQLENKTVVKKYHTGLRRYDLHGSNFEYEKFGIPSKLTQGEHLEYYCTDCGYGWIGPISNNSIPESCATCKREHGYIDSDDCKKCCHAYHSNWEPR